MPRASATEGHHLPPKPPRCLRETNQPPQNENLKTLLHFISYAFISFSAHSFWNWVDVDHGIHDHDLYKYYIYVVNSRNCMRVIIFCNSKWIWTVIHTHKRCTPFVPNMCLLFAWNIATGSLAPSFLQVTTNNKGGPTIKPIATSMCGCWCVELMSYTPWMCLHELRPCQLQISDSLELPTDYCISQSQRLSNRV